MEYKTKPCEIEATQWLGTKQSFDEVLAMGDIKWRAGDMGSDTFYIETLEGEHIVSKGDYIIKGLKGEFYPCKPDIFVMKYELKTLVVKLELRCKKEGHDFIYSHKEVYPTLPSTTGSVSEERDVAVCRKCGMVIKN